MKQFFLLCILFSTIHLSHAQIRLDSLTLQRNKIYKKYREHKDTMTINTWLNIFKLKNYLEQIVFYDSLINNEIQNRQSDKSNDLAIVQSKLENLINEKKDLNRRLSEVQLTRDSSDKNVQIAILGAIVATALLIVVLILYIILVKKLKRKNLLLIEYQTNLSNAKTEIEKFEQDKLFLTSEINTKARNFEDELMVFKEKINMLSDEKVMLENQMVEMKKAYEREVERRILAEESVRVFEQTQVNDLVMKDVESGHEEILALNSKVFLLTEELEKEKVRRQNIGNELANLLQRIREHTQ